MLLGQMSLNKVSKKADYIQLDICGLNHEEAVQRYLDYQTNLPVILHGDWMKKGCSENNIKERKQGYISIIQHLKKYTKVIGFTMHPPFRKKVSFEEFLSYCDEIETATGVSVFIENRSNEKIWLSQPDEIITFSHQHDMTIDLPQLFISCGFDKHLFMQTLKQIHWDKVKELHLANIKRKETRTFVARKLLDGELHFKELTPIFASVPYGTLEILGGVPTFEEQVEIMKCFLQEDTD
jgi:hypothetical protein